MRIVFWGSSDFSMPSLELLGKYNWIAGVVTNPDKPYGRGMNQIHQTPIKLWALQHSVPCLQPTKLRDEGFIQSLQALKPDLFVVVSYGRILPEEILSLPPLGSINLHASLLPRYRGASPIQAALLNDDRITGNTVQYMTKELDQGDIILQSELAIYPNDTYPTLSERLSHDGANLLVQAIQLISENKAPRTPQNNAEASYTRIIRREDGEITFSLLSSHEVWCRYRAYYPWPGIFTTCHQAKIPFVVHLTDIAESPQSGEAGIVLRADKEQFLIACREGSIRINKLKPAGKKEMDFLSFLNGYKIQIGKAL